MNRRELRTWTERLAGDLGLRWAAKTKRYVGLHRGVIVELSEWGGAVTFQFVAPTASVSDEILEDFAGFRCLADLGIRTGWINGLMEVGPDGEERSSNSGCVLAIDAVRGEKIGEETFRGIPDAAAKDFHAHGAVEPVPCANCDRKEATTVGLIDYCYAPMCADCWDELQFYTAGGRLETGQSVDWAYVAPALALLTPLGGYLWGAVQQPGRLGNAGVLPLALPALWAFGLCWGVPRLGRGVTRPLRVSLFASVIVSVLAGNVWGFRSHVMEELERRAGRPLIGPDWIGSVEMYVAALPDVWPSEAPFLFAGLLGAWIGLRILKGFETIDVH